MSRTHSQIGQVIRELKNTSYAPNTLVLGSRSNLCVNPRVKDLKGLEQRAMCRALSKSRSCKYKENVPTHVGVSVNKKESEIMDIEDLAKVGFEQEVCPYFMSRDASLQTKADIIFMPYNYLIDPAARRGLSIPWRNAVVLIDEAHNLESVCDDAASFRISTTHIAQCISEVDHCVRLVQRVVGGASDAEDKAIGDSFPSVDNLAKLKAVLLELEKIVDDISLQKRDIGVGATHPGTFLFDVFAKVNLTLESYGTMVDFIQETVDFHTRAPNLERLGKAISRAFDYKESVDAFKVYVSYDEHFEKKKNRTRVELLVFLSGVALEGLVKLGVYSVVLTSGTLAPLGVYAEQMRLPFGVRLENPHVVASDRVWVGVVPKGPSGRKLNSSFRCRNDRSYREELGRTIGNISRIVPDGVLVFFLSQLQRHDVMYRVLED